jgi:hypothetical protein
MVRYEDGLGLYTHINTCYFEETSVFTISFGKIDKLFITLLHLVITNITFAHRNKFISILDRTPRSSPDINTMRMKARWGNFDFGIERSLSKGKYCRHLRLALI